MFLLKKILSALAVPPFSLILLALAGLFLSRRHPRSGRWLAGFALSAMLLMSIPAVSILLMQSLALPPPITASQLHGVQAIVILGGGVDDNAPEYGTDTVGGATLQRLRYGAWLQRSSGLPILVSGGSPFGGRPEAEAMKETLEREFGAKVRWTEAHSRDTAENANLSAAMLWPAKITRIALVSHAWHLPRAVPLFERQGLEVVAAPTAYDTWPRSYAEIILPSAGALQRSSAALREWIGIAVQRLSK